MIWYGGQFYARIFLVSTLKVPANTADVALIIPLIIATGGFLVLWLALGPDRPQADHPLPSPCSPVPQTRRSRRRWRLRR